MTGNENSETNLAYHKILRKITKKRKKLDPIPIGESNQPGQENAIAQDESEEEFDENLDEYSHETDEVIPSCPCVPPYFIQENGTFRKYWEIIVIFLALYNAFMIPLQLFFDPNPDFIDNNIVRCSDAIVDLLFLIDIIFMFRTTFLEPGGEEVRDPWKIAKAYLRGRFWLDFISSVPFNALFGKSSLLLDMLGLLKLTRVSRIAPTIRKSNAP